MFGHTNDPFILSPLEQSGPRVYARPIFCFALSPSYDQDEVVRILQGGLAATKEQVPYLSAEVVDDTEAEQKGCLVLRDGDFGELRVRSLTKDQFPLTYDEFRAKNFPVEYLRQDDVCPVPVLPREGERIPVFAAQANFVDGGLILNISIYHLVADGFAISRIFAIWAQNCRKLQDAAAAETVFLSSSAFERAPLVVGHLSDPEKCNIADYREIVITDEPLPPAAKMPTLAKPYRATTYRFTALALAQLRADASADGKKAGTDEALAALLWRCVVGAQLLPAAATATATTDVLDAHPSSVLAVTVPTRQRTFPPLAPDYMGCPYIYAMPRAPTADVLDPQALGLPALARLVRRAVDAITPHYLSNIINMFQKVPDYGRLAPACFAGLGGPSVFLSSWRDLPFYETEWGPLLGGRCERVRVAREGMLNGLQLVLPTVPKGAAPEGSEGLEVAIGLEEGKVEALRRDPLWSKYAVLAE